MTAVPSKSGTHSKALQSTVLLALADAAVLPAGLITAIFLARWLGPDIYGVLSLAVALAVWVEWTISMAFSQSTIKFISERPQWQEPATAIIQLNLVTSLIAMTCMIVAAPWLAQVLNEPRLVLPLRLLSLDIPLFCLAHAHRNILAGLTRFPERAAAAAGRHLTKLVFSVALVAMGLSLTGAIVAYLAASAAELFIARRRFKPRFYGRVQFDYRAFWRYVIPLLAATVSLRVFSTIDLLMLKVLHLPTAEVGRYGAAQQLSNVPGFIAMAGSSVLLSLITRSLTSQDADTAGEMTSTAARLLILLIPFGAIAAGSMAEIAPLIFGSDYRDSAIPAALLLFAGIGRIYIQITSSIMTAAGRPNLALKLVVVLVPGAVIGHYLLIPKYGSTGAASVSAILACLVGFVSLVTTLHLMKARISIRNMIVIPIASLTMFAVALAIRATGLMVIPELIFQSLVMVIVLRVTGVTTASDMQAMLGAFCRRVPDEEAQLA